MPIASDNKPRIGLFGRRNRGKSTLLNALTGQQVAIISPEAGTTTDPVRKSMELLGVGPVVFVDTAGIDDTTHLGSQRIAATMRELAEANLAIILFSDGVFDRNEERIVEQCNATSTPFILLHSLSDRYNPDSAWLNDLAERYHTTPLVYSNGDTEALHLLIERIGELVLECSQRQANLLDGLVHQGDHIILCCPIDGAAPAGRLILPQVQVLRAALDIHATASVCQPSELKNALLSLSHPQSLVITDSQVFDQVAAVVPSSVPLTSFSLLLARAKGPFAHYIEGVKAIDRLKAGDRVLILESCTHNVSCDDIGRVKLPCLLSKHANAHIQCDVVAGSMNLLRPITDYAVVIQCGGCVATPRQIRARLAPALAAGVPITNYGIALAHLAGILPRAIKIFEKQCL